MLYIEREREREKCCWIDVMFQCMIVNSNSSKRCLLFLCLPILIQPQTDRPRNRGMGGEKNKGSMSRCITCASNSRNALAKRT